MRKFLATFSLLVFFASPALAFQPGDWVLGNWQGAGYYYPGVVSNVSGDMISINYDDGDFETLPSAYVRYYDWGIGSRVECNWQGGGVWYPGVITQLDAINLSISYDDGDYENTLVALCRSR